MLALSMLALLTGCGNRSVDLDWETGNVPEEETGTPDSADSGEEEDEHTCHEVSLDLLGPKEPVVGDTWVIWVDCDDSRLLGPMVVRFDPSDFASVDDNTAVFLYAGQGTLSVRSGVYDLSAEVTVGEADTGSGG